MHRKRGRTGGAFGHSLWLTVALGYQIIQIKNQVSKASKIKTHLLLDLLTPHCRRSISLHLQNPSPAHGDSSPAGPAHASPISCSRRLISCWTCSRLTAAAPFLFTFRIHLLLTATRHHAVIVTVRNNISLVCFGLFWVGLFWVLDCCWIWKSSSESLDHLILHCSYTREFWLLVFNLFRGQWVTYIF
jgi:hypothetical protein